VTTNKPPPVRKEPLLRRQAQAKEPPASRWQKIRRTLVGPWALFVEIVSVAAAALAFFEVYIQTLPEIDPNNSEPSKVLPFIVTNKSNFFDMTDVNLSCGIEFGLYDSGGGKWIGLGGMIFGPTEIVPSIHRHGGVIHYPCKASDFLHKNIWGDLCVGMKGACPNAPEMFQTSYTCMWIKIDYRTFFGAWLRHVNSEIFAWDGKQWRKGLVAAERSKETICGIVSDFPAN